MSEAELLLTPREVTQLEEALEWSFPSAVWQVARGNLDDTRTRSAREWLRASSEPVNALTDALLDTRRELEAEREELAGTRTAVVLVKSGPLDDAARRIERYLPANYAVTGTVQGSYLGMTQHDVVVIQGVDRAGWTLDDYVLPRLASGLYFGRELTRYDGEQ